MDLTRYVTDLMHQLEVAAQAGGDDAHAVAERLTASLDSSARLVLLEALSDAADEITSDLAPGSVEVRLRGRDPEFVVTLPAQPAAEPVVADSPEPVYVPPAEPEDGGTTRTTLRLPDHLKTRVEEAASRDGLSVNSWLVRAVTTALEPQKRQTPRPQHGGNHFTGWVR